jgi:hypothetical protein
MRRIELSFSISVIIGMVLFLFSSAIRPVGATSIGFPFVYGHEVTVCPNPSSGLFLCGYSYDPLSIGLDLLSWIAIVFSVAYGANALVRNRKKSAPISTERS